MCTFLASGGDEEGPTDWSKDSCLPQPPFPLLPSKDVWRVRAWKGGEWLQEVKRSWGSSFSAGPSPGIPSSECTSWTMWTWFHWNVSSVGQGLVCFVRYCVHSTWSSACHTVGAQYIFVDWLSEWIDNFWDCKFCEDQCTDFQSKSTGLSRCVTI